MAHYRKIDVRIWNDAKFRALSEAGQLVFFFILTHPHLTALGAMRATIPGLAAELGWRFDRFSKAFQETVTNGLVEHDDRSCFITAPNFLKYNRPESPNVVKSWKDSLDLLPECELKERLLIRAREFVLGMSKGFREALPEAFRKGMPNQEQEQEQEQELDKGKPSREAFDKSAFEQSFAKFWDVYPLDRDGKRLDIEDCRIKFAHIPPHQWPDVIQAAKHYAAGSSVADGYVTKPAKFLLGKWADWVEPPKGRDSAPSNGPNKLASLAELEEMNNRAREHAERRRQRQGASKP